jgi:hypothetical protein
MLRFATFLIKKIFPHREYFEILLKTAFCNYCDPFK